MNRVRFVKALAAVASLSVLTLAPELRGQSSMEAAVRQLNSGNARGYLQPLPDLLAADLGAAWYRSAALASGGLGVSLEIVGAVTSVQSQQLAYVATAPAGFTPNTFETATVFGDDGTLVQGPSGTSFRGSDGVLAGDLLPMVLPQLRLSFRGSEALLRFFVAGSEPEGFPQTSVAGLGVRHSLSQYLASSPVDIAVGAFYNSFELGSASPDGAHARYHGLALGLQASRTFSSLTLYGGVASDGGEMRLAFQSSNPDEAEPVDVTLEVKRALKFTAGLSLSLGTFTLAGDVTVGALTTFSGGLRIGM